MTMVANYASALVWYAVRVRVESRGVRSPEFPDPVKAPFPTEHRLQQRGFEVFVLRKTVYRFSNRYMRGRRLKKEMVRPLMPGWFFIGMRPGEERWRDLLETSGVIGVAGTEGRPAVVNGRVIKALAERFGDGFVSAADRERFMRSRAEYAPGQMVRVADGPFDGMAAKVVAVKGRQARILLAMFGADREVDVDAMMLEAA